MKNVPFAIWVLIGLVSCNSKSNQSQNIENKIVGYIFQPSNYYSKFRYNNLKEFRIDSLSSSAKVLAKLDSLEWKAIFQDSSSYDFDSYYFYSNFSDSTQITIFEEDEESSSDIIWLLRYDRKGKLIGKDILAIKGGDAFESWKSYGKFMNQYYVRTDLYENDDPNIEKSNQRDSSIVRLSFLALEKTKSDTLFHKNSISKY